MYLIRDNELKEFKGDHLPVGYYDSSKTDFTLHEIQLKEEDVIYLFTDGYIDQFGGANRKTFRSKYFKKLLLEIHKNNMEEQGKLLEKEFDAWKGELEQIDDILIMGMKI